MFGMMGTAIWSEVKYEEESKAKNFHELCLYAPLLFSFCFLRRFSKVGIGVTHFIFLSLSLSLICCRGKGRRHGRIALAFCHWFELFFLKSLIFNGRWLCEITFLSLFIFIFYNSNSLRSFLMFYLFIFSSVLFRNLIMK